MFPDDHFDELAHCTFRFPDFLADLVVQIQWDFAGYALCFHALSLLFSFFPFRTTQAYPKTTDKAITKTNNVSGKAGLTNVTTNKGYVGVILLSTGNQGSPSSPSEWLLPAVVWAGKAQL